jgi:hypothetical protein
MTRTAWNIEDGRMRPAGREFYMLAVYHNAVGREKKQACMKEFLLWQYKWKELSVWLNSGQEAISEGPLHNQFTEALHQLEEEAGTEGETN